jgi:predicted small lipoprotein YifL
MKRAFVALAALALLAFAGCGTLKRLYGSKAEPAKSESKLKSTNDRVVLETYYDAQSFTAPLPPMKIPYPRFMKAEWVPGEIKFQGMIMEEPLKDVGKEPKKNKGVLVEINSVSLTLNGRKGEQRKHSSFLDEAEARDLDTAISYQASKAAEWEKQKPEPKQDLNFHSRDTFGATLSFDNDGLAWFVRSGESFSSGAAFLRIPVSSLGEVQAKLRAALKTLDEH